MSRGRIRPLTIGTTRLTCATTACAATAYSGLRLRAKQNRGAAGKGGGSQASQDLRVCTYLGSRVAGGKELRRRGA